jgi:pyridoxamine 5'-phosphate oxidase
MATNISSIRTEYKQKQLSEFEAAKRPLEQFHIWFQQAVSAEAEEVNAMTLATCDNTGVPSARIVLLKGFDENGFVFFTNYTSQKGLELTENPRAALVFFWPALERQIRITGIVKKISEMESDTYFYSRPLGSQIGAIASPQSQVIPNREWLESKEKEISNSATKENVIRPVHWGGYRVQPVNMEFWQGRPSRLHDRLLYTLKDDGTWTMERLAP